MGKDDRNHFFLGRNASKSPYIKSTYKCPEALHNNTVPEVYTAFLTAFGSINHVSRRDFIGDITSCLENSSH